jgi:hypothetical protein
MNRDRINDIVTADLPTPPSPSTCILMTLFSATIAKPEVVPVCGLCFSFVRGEKGFVKDAVTDRYCGGS